MSKIFLCHASEDKKFVEKLAKDLMRFGFEVWFDKFEMKVGESLLEKINEGITGSGYFAVVLSSHSVGKPWVKHEIQSAFAKKFKDENFKILPVLYEECDVPLYLAGLLYADFSGDYDKGFQDILNVFGMKDTDICTEENWRQVHKVNRKNKDWKRYKDAEYRDFVTAMFYFCYDNRGGLCVGGHSNPYAVNFSAEYRDRDGRLHREYINIRLCADDVYRLSKQKTYNPNHLKASDYSEYLGDTPQQARENLMQIMLKLNEQYGKPRQTEMMYQLRRFMTEEEKEELLNSIMNFNYIFDGDFHNTIRRLQEEDNDGEIIRRIYL